MMNWNAAMQSELIEDSILNEYGLTELEESKIDVWIALVKKYGTPFPGRHRVAFSNGRCVFKFPINDYGYHDNAWEYHKFRNRTEKSLPMARCRIIDIKEIPVLVMEFVTQVPYGKDMPSWADFIDCQQVGWNKKGEIVAYDYA